MIYVKNLNICKVINFVCIILSINFSFYTAQKEYPRKTATAPIGPHIKYIVMDLDVYEI